MSGHQSELGACGIKHSTVWALHETTKVALDDVFALFHFEYTKGVGEGDGRQDAPFSDKQWLYT